MVRYWCAVPLCKNTSNSTPEKKFITVPLLPAIRKKWYTAMRRADEVARTSHIYCCEDHFNLETDLENYVKFSLIGGKMILKKGVVPHKFDCQRILTTAQTSNPEGKTERRNQRKILDTSLSIDLQSEPSTDAPVVTSHNFAAPNHSPSNSYLYDCDHICSVATQTDPVIIRPKIFFRAKGTTTDPILTSFVHRSPTKRKVVQSLDSATSPIKLPKVAKRPREPSPVSSVCEAFCYDDSDYKCSAEDGDSDYVPEDPECLTLYPFTEKKMLKNPKGYMGIELNCSFVLYLIAQYLKTNLKSVLLCLRKIRLNEPFSIIKDDFDISEQRASKIFHKTLQPLAYLIGKLVVWPDLSTIKLKLPIQFRARYSNVVAIIDCLEIAIQKPQNPLHQSLTWSEYKKANTLKYLIACTPDGTCSFISKGFGGRTSDSMILRQCGFLDRLRPGMEVMADRGFKQVESLLAQRGCKLVRPPSTSASARFTASQVKATKRVASLRIHVERVIGRIRNFSFLAPHACVSNKLTAVTDSVIIIVCALINLQPPIIRQ